ncbi:Zinc finger, C2H2 [Trichophyton rubrum]|nr:Zinc finger, C2H2 [Trichophyton rubrum]
MNNSLTVCSLPPTSLSLVPPRRWTALPLFSRYARCQDTRSDLSNSTAQAGWGSLTCNYSLEEQPLQADDAAAQACSSPEGWTPFHLLQPTPDRTQNHGRCGDMSLPSSNDNQEIVGQSCQAANNHDSVGQAESSEGAAGASSSSPDIQVPASSSSNSSTIGDTPVLVQEIGETSSSSSLPLSLPIKPTLKRNRPAYSSQARPQAWRCAYPKCSSQKIFTRPCDLRKHYRRHSQRFYCRFPGCPHFGVGHEAAGASMTTPRASGKGRRLCGRRWFSSEKDRARHEAMHNPQIRCAWEGCNRVFSRLDNMKDHARRIHGVSSTAKNAPGLLLNGDEELAIGVEVDCPRADSRLPVSTASSPL